MLGIWKGDQSDDERVEFAIHNLLHIARFNTRSQIFYHAVRLKYVAANLITPGDFAFDADDFRQFGVALGVFELLQLGLENAHPHALVLRLAALILAGTGLVVRDVFFGPRTITAYFTTATAIYPSDEVRVSGVKVGTIKSIEPAGTQAKMILKVDRGVPIPADAKAVIVTQNLVAARYVELTPAYRTTGPVMPDGAVIPVERTAVPVEWDDVKTQLMRL